jgi:2-haloacid dehalogenase
MQLVSQFPNAKACLFDAYGTLFDVNAAVMRHAARIGPDAERFAELWRTKQTEYSWLLTLSGRWVDFWTLTERALDFSFARFPHVDRALRPPLLDAYKVLDAYPDAQPTLAGLRARGLRTAILSNGSRAMLASAVASAGLDAHLDAVVSVDAVRVFKTHAAVYARGLAELGLAAADVVFVSSNRWDVAGATAAGLACVWINRRDAPDEYPELAPVAVASGLAALLA